MQQNQRSHELLFATVSPEYGRGIYAAAEIAAGTVVLADFPCAQALTREAVSRVCCVCLAEPASGAAERFAPCRACNLFMLCESCVACAAPQHAASLHCQLAQRHAAALARLSDVEFAFFFLACDFHVDADGAAPRCDSPRSGSARTGSPLHCGENASAAATAAELLRAGPGSSRAELLTLLQSQSRGTLEKMSAELSALLQHAGCFRTDQVQQLWRVILLNAFLASSPAGSSYASALYPKVSLLNHACFYNCYVRYENAATPQGALRRVKAEVFAVRDIAQGEQLFISYVDVINSAAARNFVLSEHYGFECRCFLCQCPRSNPAQLAEQLQPFIVSRRYKSLLREGLARYCDPQRALECDANDVALCESPLRAQVLAALQAPPRGAAKTRTAQFELAMQQVDQLRQLLHPLNRLLYRQLNRALELAAELNFNVVALLLLEEILLVLVCVTHHNLAHEQVVYVAELFEAYYAAVYLHKPAPRLPWLERFRGWFPLSRTAGSHRAIT